jgi:probable phosphoglycerate mutase
VLGALERLRQEHAGERVLVVTHGGCLALLGSWLHTGGVSEPQPYLSVNCGLSAVGWLEDAHAVEFWNDGSHLAERNPA